MSKAIEKRESEPTGGRVPVNLDAEPLAAELCGNVRGEVRFDNGSRALYATDASNYHQVPIGVVIPRDLITWTCT